MYLVFTPFTSKTNQPPYLTVTDLQHSFLLLRLIYVFAQQIKISVDRKANISHFIPIPLAFMDLPNNILYSKAKLKSDGLFQTTTNSICSDKRLPTWTLPQVSFKHILIRLTIFMGIPNSMKIL
jgi:hypothetical protein